MFSNILPLFQELNADRNLFVPNRVDRHVSGICKERKENVQLEKFLEGCLHFFSNNFPNRTGEKESVRVLTRFSKYE